MHRVRSGLLSGLHPHPGVGPLLRCVCRRHPRAVRRWPARGRWGSNPAGSRRVTRRLDRPRPEPPRSLPGRTPAAIGQGGPCAKCKSYRADGAEGDRVSHAALAQGDTTHRGRGLGGFFPSGLPAPLVLAWHAGCPPPGRTSPGLWSGACWTWRLRRLRERSPAWQGDGRLGASESGLLGPVRLWERRERCDGA